MAQLTPDEEVDEMTAATWRSVEAMGMPDSPIRRVLFDLAEIIQTGTGNEVGLASIAYLPLMQELQQLYQRKTPLQEQLEHIRASKELFETIGVRLPEVRGDRFVLNPVPETPAALAAELGYADGGKAVRRVLRQRFAHEKGTPWPTLDEQQVNYVRAHLPARNLED